VVGGWSSGAFFSSTYVLFAVRDRLYVRRRSSVHMYVLRTTYAPAQASYLVHALCHTVCLLLLLLHLPFFSPCQCKYITSSFLLASAVNYNHSSSAVPLCEWCFLVIIFLLSLSTKATRWRVAISWSDLLMDPAGRLCKHLSRPWRLVHTLQFCMLPQTLTGAWSRRERTRASK